MSSVEEEPRDNVKRQREVSGFGRWVQSSVRFLLSNSAFLILGSLAALAYANIDHEEYEHLVHGKFHFVVNDVLMCFFFGIAAKEIWEALLPGGALSSLKKAATPLMATLGGVLMPAGVYVAGALILGRQDLVRGWAIPCATDIAFSYLVARIVFGAGHPAIPFLLLLAIADDAAGLLILAIFYPTGAVRPLIFFACVIGAIVLNLVLKRYGIKSFWAYLIIAGPLSWWGFYKGGIHPALALVPIIPTMPTAGVDAGIFAESQMSDSERPTDTLNEFEHFWKNPVELILMLFGFANAGVLFGAIGAGTALVALGLFVGKPVGIFFCTLFAVKVLRLEMPEGMTLKDVVVLGMMAAIGFTVALFVSGVAFEPGPALDSAKMGALLSFAAAFVAIVLGRVLKVGVKAEKPAAEGQT